jgi:hypothetical protein
VDDRPSATESIPASLVDQLPPELRALAYLDRPERWEGLVDEIDWTLLGGLARYHRLSGHLAGTLAALGTIAAAAGVRSEAEADRMVTRERFQAELLPQLDELCLALLAVGVVPVVLKGASLVLTGATSAGDRPMSDLDILVPRDRARTAQRVLAELGYRTSVPTAARDRAWHRHYQDAPHHHPDKSFGVDLHWHIQYPKHRVPFEVTDLTSTELLLPTGTAVQRLSDQDELTHLCLHFWADREQARPGALGQLWDVAVASDRLDGGGWSAVREEAHRRGHARTLAAILALTDILLDKPAPPQFPEIADFARDEWLRSFAIRRVLAPRPAHIQLFMVTPDVPYTLFRTTTRAVSYLRRGPAFPDGDRTSGPLAWGRHTRHIIRLLARALRHPLDTYAEAMLDRWAHGLDVTASTDASTRDPVAQLP